MFDPAVQPEQPTEEAPVVMGGEDAIVIDFSKVGIVPPEGTYILTITKSTRKSTKEGGRPMLSLICSIVSPEEYKGVVIYDNLMLSEPGLARTKPAFEAIFGQATSGIPASAFVGRQFYCHLKPDNDPTFGNRAVIAYYGA